MITEAMVRAAKKDCFKFRSTAEGERFYRVLSKWSGPTSVCTCGHAGNGPRAATVLGLHAGPIGHGACIVKGCNCARFTHHAYTTDYVVAIIEARSACGAELTPAMRVLLDAANEARRKNAAPVLRPATSARGSRAKRAPVSAAARRERRRSSMSPAEKERFDNGERYWSDDAAAARRSRS